MPRWRPSWSDARTWFVTVRLLEVAAVVILASGVVAMYTRWGSVDQPGMTMPDGSPIDFSLWDRVAIAAGSIWLGPEISGGLVVAAVLVLAGVVILHRVRPVQNARLLRWELLGVGALQVLASLVTVFMWVVAGLVQDPYHQGLANQDPNVVTGDTGAPDVFVVALGNLGVPVASVLLGAVAAVWWLRLPSFDDDESLADGEQASSSDDLGNDGAGEARRPGWRAQPAPDANDDDISLDGVEQIAPVERLSPRDDGGRVGDGGTSSGYDDYFRRF